ncbi:hypothetical protein lbkm_4021 [Lachnospiraceae bacterium KM106-2]|nr:hypothetical protein lbkm_4021 [Lachnospiraceae bacterium KM106-2]
MCGRYYVDDEMVSEIEKLVRQIDADLAKTKSGDIFPTNFAPVVVADHDEKNLTAMKWGFPNFSNKGVIINARAETVLEKRMFAESVRNRRCLIPARGFYEWDIAKEKISFERKDDQIVYMAGIFKPQAQNQFVILTTAANDSMKEIHNRMPLVLEKEEVDDWLFEPQAVEFILHKTPVALKHYIKRDDS